MNEISDAAWFYSSLAQASASIVGIIGAIFLSRMTDYFENRMREKVGHENGVITMAGAFRDFIFRLGSDQELEKNGVPSAEWTAARALVQRYPRRRTKITARWIETSKKQLRAASGSVSNEWIRSAIAGHIRELEDEWQRIASFREKLRPPSLWAVWVLLAWLALVGVVWPLSVLPGLSSPAFASSKAWMLTLFSIGAAGFILYLLYELMRLHRLGSFRWPDLESRS